MTHYESSSSFLVKLMYFSRSESTKLSVFIAASFIIFIQLRQVNEFVLVYETLISKVSQNTKFLDKCVVKYENYLLCKIF
jgi:hypothetical protein